MGIKLCDGEARCPLPTAALGPRSLPAGMRRRGSQPLLSHVRSVAHRLPAQGPQISCLRSALQVSAPAYCKLGAFFLQNPGALARKPWNFPSKESAATPGHRKVTNGQTRNEFQGGSTSPAHVSGAPTKGTGKLHKQNPERPGSVWAAGRCRLTHFTPGPFLPPI